MQSPRRIFISYSHDDEALRKAFEKHLASLARRGLAVVWTDRDVDVGAKWEDATVEELDQADIVVLLVSASFIASEHCWTGEMERAMTRHAAGKAHVVPVIIKPCSWEKLPFGNLQALPNNRKPVTEWRPRDKAWLSVVDGIAGLLGAEITKTAPPEPPAPAPAATNTAPTQSTAPAATNTAPTQSTGPTMATTANHPLDPRTQLEISKALQRAARSVRATMEDIVMQLNWDMGNLRDDDWLGLVRAIHAGAHGPSGDRAHAVRKLVEAALVSAPGNDDLLQLLAKLQ